MWKDGSVFAVQPMENLDRQFDFDAPRHVKKCSRRDQRLMQCGELGRAEDGRLRHEIFSKQFAVLDHGTLKRLENDATLFQLIGNNIAFDELVASENQTGRDFVEPARLLENRVPILIRQCSAEFERRKIEKADIGKSPGLIFSRWIRQGFKLLPRRSLLIIEPIWEIPRACWARKNRARNVRRFAFNRLIQYC